MYLLQSYSLVPVEPLSQNLEFSWNHCEVNVYLLFGRKNEVKHFKTSFCFRKCLCTFILYILSAKSDMWLTVHRNSVWIRNQLDVSFVLSFISPLQVAQHVLGNHVPIFRS